MVCNCGRKSKFSQERFFLYSSVATKGTFFSHLVELICSTTNFPKSSSLTVVPGIVLLAAKITPVPGFWETIAALTNVH
jgi:hypothetical protein